MSRPPKAEDPRVEQEVRDHLARLQAAHGDAGETMLARVRASMAMASGSARPAPKVVRGASWGRVGWAAGLAASILALVLAWGVDSSRHPVRADVLVREAREAHAAQADRLYRARATPRPGALARYPGLKGFEGFRSELWTRGDRFWVRAEGGEASVVWGREASGRTWVVASPRVGLTFEPGEVPEALALAADLLSLSPEAVLGEVLEGFDLTEETPDPDDGPGLVRIRAVPRAGRPQPRLHSAVLDIDRRTKVVRRLTLARGPADEPRVDVAFTLAEGAGAQPDAAYTLAGHLEADAEVLGAERPIRRRQQLIRQLGPFSRVAQELRKAREARRSESSQ